MWHEMRDARCEAARAASSKAQILAPWAADAEQETNTPTRHIRACTHACDLKAVVHAAKSQKESACVAVAAARARADPRKGLRAQGATRIGSWSDL